MGENDREKHIVRYIQTKRQAYIQATKQTNIHTANTYIQAYINTECHTYREIYTHTYTHT